MFTTRNHVLFEKRRVSCIWPPCAARNSEISESEPLASNNEKLLKKVLPFFQHNHKLGSILAHRHSDKPRSNDNSNNQNVIRGNVSTWGAENRNYDPEQQPPTLSSISSTDSRNRPSGVYNCRTAHVLVIICLYIVIGGYFFMLLEQPHHDEVCKDAKKRLKKYTLLFLEEYPVFLEGGKYFSEDNHETDIDDSGSVEDFTQMFLLNDQKDEIDDHQRLVSRHAHVADHDKNEFADNKFSEVSFQDKLLSIKNPTQRMRVFLSEYTEKIYQHLINHEKMKDECLSIHPEWTFPQSVFYAITLITTIGYGNQTPKSDICKMITIFYAVFGFCLVGFYIQRFGCSVKRTMYNLQLKFRIKNSTKHRVSFYLAIFVGCFILLPSSIFYFVENIYLQKKDWTFISTIYYVIITLSTVGLGDYIPTIQPTAFINGEGGNNHHQISRAYDLFIHTICIIYSLAILFWILLGLVYMKISLELVADSMEAAMKDTKKISHDLLKRSSRTALTALDTWKNRTMLARRSAVTAENFEDNDYRHLARPGGSNNNDENGRSRVNFGNLNSQKVETDQDWEKEENCNLKDHEEQ